MLEAIKKLFSKSEKHPLEGATRPAQERAEQFNQRVTQNSQQPTNTPEVKVPTSKAPAKKPLAQKSRSQKSGPSKKKK